MTVIPAFDAGLLRRYDRPGPRYNSYPNPAQFDAGFNGTAFRDAARLSNDDPIPRNLSLYVHVPYCFHPCFACGGNQELTGNRTRADAYLARLVREVAMVAPLFDCDRDVTQLHLGGGSPNFLNAGQLGELMESLHRHFHFAGAVNRDLSIEVDPRCVDQSDIEALAFMGFNRVSLRVQDFDPGVPVADDRMHPVKHTLGIIEACRKNGFRSIDVNLIYGFPGQSRQAFGRTLESLIRTRPDRLAVYNYADLPQLFNPQKPGLATELPSAESRIALLQLAFERLLVAGYRYIGMDHFALPGDEIALAQEHGSLQRNFLGYTGQAESDLIGLGVSAISHIGDTFCENPRNLPAWESAIDSGRLPVCGGLQLNADDLLRADLIQQLICRGVIDIPTLEQRHDIHFLAYFHEDLLRMCDLAIDGLVETSETQIQVTSRGRLLLRIIAECFDRYLHQPRAEPARLTPAI